MTVFRADEPGRDAKKNIVNWICSHDNDIMIEYGEDFKNSFGHLDFKMQMSK